MLTIAKSKFFNKYLPLVLSGILLVTGLGTYFVIQQSKKAEADWFSTGQGSWNYRQKITIDHTKVSTVNKTTLTGFPVLISVTSVSFKSVSNGGHVGLDSGNDIVFTKADGLTKIPHEIEKYEAATGTLIAWVKIPSLSPTIDTTIYMYYGNAGETGNEQNSTAVWDSNYKAVYHLANGVALNVNDSTGQHNATNNGPVTATVGKIDGGANGLTSTSYYLDTGYSMLSTTDSAAPYTISAWFSQTNNSRDVISQYITNDAGRTSLEIVGVVKLFKGGSSQITGTKTVTDGSFHNVTLIKNSSKVVTMYIDGVQDGSTYTDNATTANINTYIGKANYSFSGGIIDEVRFSNIARTPDWIKTEYNNQNNPSTFSTFGGEETQPTANVKGTWYNSSWAYRKKLTIDKTKVSTASSTTLSNFPVLVSLTDASLKSIANGGHMASSTAADLVFTDSSGTTKLNHEIEKYDPTTGQLIAWVQLPTLSPSADTDIYLYYDNPNITVSQENKAGMWNGYLGIWHLDANGSSVNASDSSPFGYNGSITGTPTATSTGRVGGAAWFTNTSDKIDTSALPSYNTVTVSFWTKRTNNNVWAEMAGNSTTYGWYLDTGSAVSIAANLYRPSAQGGAARRFWNNNVALNTWYHVVYQYDGSYLTGYINGSLVESYPFVGGTPSGGGRTITIGSGSSGLIMDELEITEAVRSADWIATEYNNQSDQTIGAGHFYKALSSEQAVTNLGWYSSWGYRKKVIINHTQVSGTSTLASFPVLVSVTSDPLLKSVSNGGHMASSTAADLMFTSADGSTKIPYELEKYDPTTGQLIAWVKTDVSPFTDTVLYMYYGNPNIAASQANPTAVWSNGYAGVWHLSSMSGATAITDSTSNQSNSISNSGTAASGSIDGGGSYASASSQYTDITNQSLYNFANTTFTVSVWANTLTAATGILISKNGYSAGWYVGLNNTGTAGVMIKNSGGNATYRESASTNLTNGSWHYITAVITTNTSAVAGNDTQIYVDGVLNQGTITKSSVYSTDTMDVNLGRRNPSSAFYYNGSMDEARISSIARSASWIKTEFNNQNLPSTFESFGGEESSIKTTTNTTWYSADWLYKKKITIDHRQVSGSSALTDFPVLVSLTDPQLKSVSNGGLVASTTGADILFTSADGKTKLDHEIEKYDSSTGQLIAWVRIPSLSPTSDTVINMYFGNPSAADQSNKTGVWSNYVGVWHMHNASTAITDSTSGSNSGTPSSAGTTFGVTGKIGGAISRNGNPTQINFTNPSIFYPTTPKTYCSWLITTSDPMIRFAPAGTSYPSIRVDSGRPQIALSATNYKLFVASAGTTMADGNWHQVCFLITGIGQNDIPNSKMWLDGNSVAVDSTVTGSPSSFNGFNIGYYLTGSYDEFGIANSALSDAWIKTEYNNQSNPRAFAGVGALEKIDRPAGAAGVGMSSRGAETNWNNGGWTSRKTLIIDHSKVSGTAALTDFPVLVSLTDADWKTVANGGYMGKNDGTDMYFTDMSGNKLAHEIESYNGATGQIIVWVKIPSLSPKSNTNFYIYYGNASASDMQTVSPTKIAVWSNGYAGVWHLPNGSDLSANDSVAGGHNGTITSVAATPGKIDGAANFNGIGTVNFTDQNVFSPSANGNILTISTWVNIAENGTADGEGSNYRKYIYSKGILSNYEYNLYRTNASIEFGLYSLAGTGNIIGLKSNYGVGQWYYVTIVLNGSQILGYMDGLFATSTNITVTTGNGSAPLILGNRQGSGYFKGITDELNISTVVRSPAWIKTEYNNQFSPAAFVRIGQADSSARSSSTPLMNVRGNGVKFH